MRRTLTVLLAATAFILAGTLTAAADQIEDQINKALNLYKGGQVSQALTELDFAAAQLRQMKAESLGNIFPEAPDGWKAQKVKTGAMGAGMMGGGISAEREYRQDGGRGRVSVKVISDSPMLQGLAMMMSNPMFAQGGDGGKLMLIDGHKVMLKEQADDRAELQTIVNNKVLVEVNVSRTQDAAQVSQDFFKMLDMQKLGELTK
jgi:hypothetical protein